jgi:hypothetical protein
MCSHACCSVRAWCCGISECTSTTSRPWEPSPSRVARFSSFSCGPRQLQEKISRFSSYIFDVILRACLCRVHDVHYLHSWQTPRGACRTLFPPRGVNGEAPTLLPTLLSTLLPTLSLIAAPPNPASKRQQKKAAKRQRRRDARQAARLQKAGPLAAGSAGPVTGSAGPVTGSVGPGAGEAQM